MGMAWLACTAAQGPTWQQAVQWIGEVPVQAGDRLVITAKHDTYGIAFSLQQQGRAGSAVAEPSSVPLWVRVMIARTAHRITLAC